MASSPSDIQKIALKTRKPEHEVSELFIGRWSPRAMTGATVPETQLQTLFEAARWAPSCFNEQPWRILYARRDTPQWQTFFNLLVEFNQSWTKNAGALLLFISKKTFIRNGKPIRTHSFDTGAAWENLALQGTMLNLVVHGMDGFDHDKTRRDLNIPDDYQIEAMAAVGIPASTDTLPADLKEKETPSSRRALAETVIEGGWKLT
jgi:nitroreductase